MSMYFTRFTKRRFVRGQKYPKNPLIWDNTEYFSDFKYAFFSFIDPAASKWWQFFILSHFCSAIRRLTKR